MIFADFSRGGRRTGAEWADGGEERNVERECNGEEGEGSGRGRDGRKRATRGMKEEPKGLNGSSCGGCWAKGPNGWTGEDRRCAEELRWGKGCAPLGPPIPLAPKSWPSPSTLVPALVCSSQSGPPSPKYVFRSRGHLASDEMKTAKRFLEQVPPPGFQGPKSPRSHTRGVCLGPWTLE